MTSKMNDLKYYYRIVTALCKTMEIQEKIDEIYSAYEKELI